MDTRPDQPIMPEISQAELINHIRHLELQVNNLQQTQTIPSASPGLHHTNHYKTKVPTPQPFYGKRHQVKPFLSGLNIYITLRGHEFPDEKTKLLFAASLLRGPAFDWFRPYEQSLSTGLTHSGSLSINKIEDFYEQINTTFGDPDESLTAATRIYKLSQTTSVASYVSEFQRLSSQLSWNEEALKDFFFQGLKPAIKDNIIRGTMPTTLKDMIRLASNLDSRIQHTRHYQPSNFTAPRSFQRPASEPMDLDGLSYSTKANPAPQGKQPRGPLSQQEKQHRLDNKLCLYCGKAGHTVQSCYGAKRANQDKPKNFKA